MRPGTHNGEFAMTMPVSPQVVNTSGALQGGLIATLVDVAGGQFGLEYLQPGTTMTTADLFVRYLRPIRQGSAFAVPRMLRSRPAGDGHADRHLRRRRRRTPATATVNFAIINGPTPKSGLQADG